MAPFTFYQLTTAAVLRCLAWDLLGPVAVIDEARQSVHREFVGRCDARRWALGDVSVGAAHLVAALFVNRHVRLEMRHAVSAGTGAVLVPVKISTAPDEIKPQPRRLT